MLESQLFPSPEPVIREMFAPWIQTYEDRWGHEKSYLKHPAKFICDPSAGNGAILDYLHNKLGVERRYLWAIEIQPDLRAILREKGYQVVGSDFLEYEEAIEFELFAMNPPFSEGVKHLLHAWKLLYAGDVVCLLNWESIANVCTMERRILQELIKKHGSVINLGQCFKDSERPTDVEIALVRLHKDKPEPKFKLNLDGLDQDERIVSESFTANPLASANMIHALVAQYKTCQQILVDRHDQQKKLDWYLSGISDPVRADDYRSTEDKSLYQRVKINDQVAILKSRFWQTVFDRTQMGKRAPSTFLKKFKALALENQTMAFTERNVMEVLEILVTNYNAIMMDCCVEIFDKAISYHADNKIHVEGWKSNSAYKLNKKIIWPWGVSYQYGSFGCWNSEDFYNDLDRILCWISGIRPDQEDFSSTASTVRYLCDYANRNGTWNDPANSTFFKVRIFRKGTVHLTFHDLDLLGRFNHTAAQGKKWIGSNEPYKPSPSKPSKPEAVQTNLLLSEVE